MYFLKLHNKRGKCIYVNMDNVISLERKNDITRVFEIGNSEYIEIKETPEEIMSKI